MPLLDTWAAMLLHASGQPPAPVLPPSAPPPAPRRRRRLRRLLGRLWRRARLPVAAPEQRG